MLKICYSGKRALILGGSCDMGLALAEAMTTLALYPLLTYRDPRGHARIAERLGVPGRDYEAVHLELKTPLEHGQLDSLLNQGVDYLVDFAHGDLEGLVAAVDGSAVNAFFDAHITARAAVIQQVARAMLRNRKGRMVLVSSTAAGRPHPGQGFYAAAKQAAEALYRSLGVELAGRGVTTVVLRPGYVDAGRGRRYLEQHANQALSKVPLGRALTVAEIVQTVMFLLCEEAMGFNAAVLTMDGGMSAGK
jgi:3-oxoacyl-[acyl-carrier protein] reductase